MTDTITALSTRWQRTGPGTWAALKGQYRCTVTDRGGCFAAYVGGIFVGQYPTLASAKAAAAYQARP